MSVRRGRATVRLSAGLLLTAACALGPAAEQAAPQRTQQMKQKYKPNC